MQKTKEVTGYILNLLVSAYMLLILAVQPFYNRQGFTYIGTDKAYFFRQCSMRVGMILLPVLVVYIIANTALKNNICKKNIYKTNILENWHIRDSISLTDLFALLYGVSVTVSYACSGYKEEALTGTREWYMGLTAQLTLVAIYFLVSRMWERNSILLSILPVSTIVFLLGILNRFGIYPVDMQVKNPGFISTIGNINWYCGYLVTVFFGGVVVFWQADWGKRWHKVLFAVYVAVGFTTLVTQGSSSGIVAMAAVLLTVFCLSAADRKRMWAFWEIMAILSAVCLGLWLIQFLGIGKMNYVEDVTALLTRSSVPFLMGAVSIFFLAWLKISGKQGKYCASTYQLLARILCLGVTVLLLAGVTLLIVNTATSGRISSALGMPEENIITFSPHWGSSRGVTWRAAATCFAEQDFVHKLVGVGPDCMSAFLYTDGSEKLVAFVKERFATSRLTNAHNEWLTILVNMGILGLVSYVGMICTAILRFLRARRESRLAEICGFCILAYTINNMFSFQQAMNAPTLFILLGAGENYLRNIAD